MSELKGGRAGRDHAVNRLQRKSLPVVTRKAAQIPEPLRSLRAEAHGTSAGLDQEQDQKNPRALSDTSWITYKPL